MRLSKWNNEQTTLEQRTPTFLIGILTREGAGGCQCLPNHEPHRKSLVTEYSGFCSTPRYAVPSSYQFQDKSHPCTLQRGQIKSCGVSENRGQGCCKVWWGNIEFHRVTGTAHPNHQAVAADVSSSLKFNKSNDWATQKEKCNGAVISCHHWTTGSVCFRTKVTLCLLMLM